MVWWKGDQNIGLPNRKFKSANVDFNLLMTLIRMMRSTHRALKMPKNGPFSRQCSHDMSPSVWHEIGCRK